MHEVQTVEGSEPKVTREKLRRRFQQLLAPTAEIGTGRQVDDLADRPPEALESLLARIDDKCAAQHFAGARGTGAQVTFLQPEDKGKNAVLPQIGLLAKTTSGDAVILDTNI